MKSKKLNNSGFTLIELIVTIAVLAIVIVPFLRSFFLSMDLNADSRRIQNATSVAQSVMEELQMKKISNLTTYKDVDGVVVNPEVEYVEKDGKKYPIYTFMEVYYEGADEEEFFLDIKLDSTTYSDASSDADAMKKIAVNSISSPQFSSLFGSECMMLLGQYTNVDNNLSEYASLQGVSEAGYTATYFTKSTDMKITCTYDSGIYKYAIAVDMTYTSKTDPSKKVVVTKTTSKTYSEEEGHSIYFVMPVYDNVDEDERVGSNYYASDSLNVLYTYNNNGSNVEAPDLSLYIAAQECGYASGGGVTMNICYKNVFINGTPIYNYSNTSNFKVYTNIENYEAVENNIQGLTYNDKLDNALLFAVTISVKYDDEVIATFTSSKEESYDK